MEISKFWEDCSRTPTKILSFTSRHVFMYKIIVSEITTTTSQLQDPVSISDVPILCLNI